MFFSSSSSPENAASLPTIFELNMAASMSASLKAGFDYFLGVLSTESSLARVANLKNNELFLVVMFLIERHFLTRYDASFAENFYGLKRVMVVPRAGQPASATQFASVAMTPVSKLTSLVELVIFPYVLRKLRMETAAMPVNPRDEHIARSATRVAVAGFEVATLAFQIRYLFGRTIFPHPLHWLQNVALTRLTAEDYRKFEAVASPPGGGASTTTMDALKSRVYQVFRVTFLASAILMKFAEFYFSPAMQDAQKRAGAGSSLSLPPPVPLPPTERGMALLTRAGDPKLCPLCAKPRTNPCVASSGFCFCQQCLTDYVALHRACPITDAPCSLNDIRRVYLST